MKNKIQLLSPLFLIILFFSPGYSQCKVKSIVSECKANLKPFYYDSYAFNNIEFKNKSQKIEVQFTAFLDQKYKLVFCSSGFEEKVKMKIYYDNGNKNKNRIQVYDSDKVTNNTLWSFEPHGAGDYYIEYDVPPSLDSAKKKKGCIVILIGMKT